MACQNAQTASQVVVLRDAQGKYQGSFAVLTDITAQKQVEQALLQAKEAAERAHLLERERRQESERRQRLAEGLAEVLPGCPERQTTAGGCAEPDCPPGPTTPAAQAAAIYSLEGPGGTFRPQATQGSIGALFSERSLLVIGPVLHEAVARRQPVTSIELSTAAGHNLDLNRQTELTSHTEEHWHLSGGAHPARRPRLWCPGGVSLRAAVNNRRGQGNRRAIMTAQAALAVENTRLRDEVQEAAIAAERTRLARDLHDSVTHGAFFGQPDQRDLAAHLGALSTGRRARPG